jgi:RNA polymerase-associated protein CTR9
MSSAPKTQSKSSSSHHNYVVVPLLDDRDRNATLLLQKDDVNERLLKFMERHDIPLETWLDCCMVSLESGDLDLCTRFAEKASRVARNGPSRDRSSSKSRDRSHDEQTGRYMRIKTLCFLGDLYVEKSRVVEDVAKKRELTNAANESYLDAQRIDPKEMLPHLGIGEVAMLTGNVAVARKEFGVAQRSRSNGRRSVAGHLALGRLEFKSKNYSVALKLYRSALKECPECPAEVRSAIGACHFCLGNMTKAKQAFERALELNSRCIVAYIGLGVMETIDAQSNGEVSLKKTPSSLFKAFRQDPNNPYSTLLLSEFSLGQGMFDEALQFADLAMERLPVDDSVAKAQLTGLIGRLYHAKGDVEMAMDYYKSAIKMDRAACRSARLGLAQLSTSKRDLTQASSMFQQLMQEYPTWVDIASYFGPLLPHFRGGMLKNKELIKEFARMVEEVAVDPKLWEVLGDIVCLEEPARALKAYSKSIELFMKKEGDGKQATTTGSGSDYSSVPCRLLNNAAVLYLKSGQPGIAFKLLTAAMESVKAGRLGNLHPLSQVTLGYNIARTTEAMGDLQSAEKEYLGLLKEFPKYADCQLRLACICKKRGDINGAEKWARDAAASSSNGADALGLLAGIHIDRRDMVSAKKSIDELIAALPPDSKNVEVYGRLALGNVFLYSIPGDLHQTGNYEKAATNLFHAMGFYRRALEKDPGNLFAANGIGCVLAEAGRLVEAKDVFLRVQEAAAATDGFITISDASVNLAGVQLGLKQPKAAEATFQQACKKNPSLKLDPRLLLYLAKAQYESDQVNEAIKTVSKALHIAPGDHRLRFNAAYLMQQAGAKVLQQEEFVGGDEGKVAAYCDAAISFENSHRIFKALVELGQSQTGIPSKKVQHHVAFAADMHKSALAKVAAAEQAAEAAEKKRHEVMMKKKVAEKAKEIEAQRKAAEAEAEKRRREEIARAADEQHRQTKQAWLAEKKVRKAVQKGDISDIPEKQHQPLPQVQSGADELEALFGSESDDEEYVPGDEQPDVAPPEPEGGNQEEKEEIVDSGNDDESDGDGNEDHEKEAKKWEKQSKGKRKASSATPPAKQKKSKAIVDDSD